MKAIKGNKVYTISESQKQFYIDGGFDIVGDNGEILAHGKGKMIPYEKYAAIAAELEETKANAAGNEEIAETLKLCAAALQIDLGRTTAAGKIAKKIRESLQESEDHGESDDQQ